MLCCLMIINAVIFIVYSNFKRKYSTRQLQQASQASIVRSLQTTAGCQQATIRPSQATVQSDTYPPTSSQPSWNSSTSYNTRETTFTLIPAPPRPPAYNPFYNDNEHGTVRSINNPSISCDDNPPQADNVRYPSYNPYYHGNFQSTLQNHDPSDLPPDYDTVRCIQPTSSC